MIVGKTKAPGFGRARKAGLPRPAGGPRNDRLSVFFVSHGVYNLKVFYVVIRVGAEGEFDAVGFLHADEQLRVLGAPAVAKPMAGREA